MLQAPLTIHSSSANYEVEFPAVKALSQWLPEADFLLVDDFFLGQLHPSVTDRAFFIRADESAKNFERMAELLLEFKRRGLNRSSVVLGIGGGVIQDVTTFLASIYMRGIEWNYVPSTFLAMADSCLGGKSSINVGPAKNLIGTFHPPKVITVIASLVRSLPSSELRGGLAEAAKICFCRGKASFERYLQLVEPLLSGEWSDSQLAILVNHVLSTKKWFIEADEFDRAERRLLNFGHTWGHALESATRFSVPHGQAVALGMQAAYVFMQSPAGSRDLMSHAQVLLNETLDSSMLEHFSASEFLDAFRSDKKHGRDCYSLIVPKTDAEVDGSEMGVFELHIPKNSSQEKAVLDAMLKVLEGF